MDEDVQDNDNPKIKPYNICLAAEVVENCSQRARARGIVYHVTQRDACAMSAILIKAKQRLFLSAPRFAVVGASKDQSKYGTKVELFIFY
jgi:hypothetical protein